MSELPAGWADANLLDLCDPKQWKVISSAELTDTGYVVYGANGKIGFYSTYTHEDPTLMITCRGATCGNLHVSEPKSYINGNAMALDNLAEQATSVRYLKYALLARGLGDVITGSAQPQITRQSLSEVAVRLAPLAEQTRIAQKLDELLPQVDTLKARIDSIPALLKRFRQSVLAAAVSGRLTEEWRTVNAPEIASILDEGRRTIPVDQISADEKYSLAIGPFGSNLKVSDYREEGKPLVFVREIRAERFGDEKTKFITPEKFAELNAHQISAGDILITKMGDPPGDVAIYPENAPDAVVTADCIKFRVNESIILRKFAYFQMKSELFRQKIKKISAGVAQQKVSLGNFREVALLVPPLAEQTEIVRRVEQLFAFADQLEAKVVSAKSRIDHLTQSILAKAFRGELVPQDPNDEPASALLERINAQRAAAPKAKRGRKPMSKI